MDCLESGCPVSRLLMKLSDDQLLNLVKDIIAKPDEVLSEDDKFDLIHINAEFRRRGGADA